MELPFVVRFILDQAEKALTGADVPQHVAAQKLKALINPVSDVTKLIDVFWSGLMRDLLPEKISLHSFVPDSDDAMKKALQTFLQEYYDFPSPSGSKKSLQTFYNDPSFPTIAEVLNSKSFATRLIQFLTGPEPPEKRAVENLTDSMKTYFGLTVSTCDTYKNIEDLLGSKIEGPVYGEKITIDLPDFSNYRPSEAKKFRQGYEKALEVVEKIRKIRYEKAKMVLK